MEKRLNNLKIFQPKGTGQEDGNFDSEIQDAE